MPTMSICHAHAPGGLEALRFDRAERPCPAPHEVPIQVGAVGVNRLDAIPRAGHYPLPPGTNPVLGVECGGLVVEVGVGGIVPGTRVAALLPGGGYAEYAVADHRHVLAVPTDWDDVRAASVIETYCTAHETLFELSHLASGERVLIHAGGSAVGSTAILMAKSIGTEVVATVGRADKARRLREWGSRTSSTTARWISRTRSVRSTPTASMWWKTSSGPPISPATSPSCAGAAGSPSSDC
jgi:NADPH2:quinone reductase